MKETIEKLLQLIKENPDLPVVPVVDGEIDNLSDDEAVKMYDALPWTKAIIVDVEPWDGGAIC